MPCDCTFILHTLKRASYATSPISRMELSICSMSSQHSRQKKAHVLYDNIGDKTHILRVQFAFEMELLSLFYKMHYNIVPGLGLQCVIVLFPDHTHLFFPVFNISSRKRIKMHYGRHKK